MSIGQIAAAALQLLPKERALIGSATSGMSLSCLFVNSRRTFTSRNAFQASASNALVMTALLGSVRRLINTATEATAGSAPAPY